MLAAGFGLAMGHRMGGGFVPSPYLIAPGTISPAFTFSRAQAGGALSTALASGGTTVQEFGADTPRFNGVGRRLLIEGQRTNSIRDPRNTGARAIGTAANTTLTNSVSWFWSTFSSNGLQSQIIATGTSNGLSYIDFRIFGTTTGTFWVGVMDNSGAAGLTGEVWTWSMYCALVGGSTANLTAIAANLRFPASALDTNMKPTLSATLQRYTCTGTSTANGTVYGGMALSFANGVAVDFTLRVAGAQLELGAFPSTTILPPVGTPGASTRGRDVATIAAQTGARTITGVVMVPQNAPAGIARTILSLDDGTDTNRITLRNAAAGATIIASRTTAGVTVDSTSLGSMTAGTAFRWALIVNGDGTGSALLEGGSWQTITGGPTGLSVMRIGSLNTAGSEAFGEVGRLQCTPGALSQAAAAARMAATPVT